MTHAPAIRAVALAAAAALLAACSTTSSNLRVGTDRTFLSLKDQREANLSIKVVPAVPEGAQIIGRVDASRCHRNTAQNEPTEEDVTLDLKVSAYAMGADGVAKLVVTKSSGLGQNCWYILTGDAVAFTFKKP